MCLVRSTIGLTSVAAAILLAQSPEQTHEKEAALKKSLLTLRQAIDKYTSDQHKAPQMLQNLVAKGYVDCIPVDPMTGSNTTWRVGRTGQECGSRQPWHIRRA
jgi:general secretion pathway protein G